MGFFPAAARSPRAAYDLERSNIAITDPNNPGVSLLVDGQRTRGLELGLSGNVTPQWSVLVAYAYQDGKITQSALGHGSGGAILANLPKNKRQPVESLRRDARDRHGGRPHLSQ
jgi:outer membrane receptor for monomeric catechols